jgi:hypothetical protein
MPNMFTRPACSQRCLGTPYQDVWLYTSALKNRPNWWILRVYRPTWFLNLDIASDTTYAGGSVPERRPSLVSCQQNGYWLAKVWAWGLIGATHKLQTIVLFRFSHTIFSSGVFFPHSESRHSAHARLQKDFSRKSSSHESFPTFWSLKWTGSQNSRERGGQSVQVLVETIP